MKISFNFIGIIDLKRKIHGQYYHNRKDKDKIQTLTKIEG
jgi:hypothetical protein